MPSKLFKFRNYCFTAFEKPEIILTSPFIQYIIFQEEEAPSTGRRHWQGYIELTRPCDFNQVHQLLGCNCHLEPRKGTQLQAIEYCRKLETKIGGAFEFGKPKMQGNRSDLDGIYDAIFDGMTSRDILIEFQATAIKYISCINSALKSFHNLNLIDDYIELKRKHQNVCDEIEELKRKYNKTEVGGNTKRQLLEEISNKIQFQYEIEKEILVLKDIIRGGKRE